MIWQDHVFNYGPKSQTRDEGSRQIMFYVIYPELWKFLVLELASKEAAASLMSVAAPLWFWKFWKLTKHFEIFYRNFESFEIYENFFIICKVVSKF